MSWRKAGPNAILKINPEKGPNDNFMQLVVKTRNNQGVAAKQVVCINYGADYDFTFTTDDTEEDIVFCEVQPTRRFYAHLVKTKEWSDDWGCWVYWISNLKGRVNGWCRIEHIHGKLFQVWR